MNKVERKIAIAKQKEEIKKEIIYLQEKINNLQLSQKYTIKSMRIDCTKDGYRAIILTFKETFNDYAYIWENHKLGEVLVKEKLNMWAMVNLYQGYGYFESKIHTAKPFSHGGVSFDSLDKDGNEIHYDFNDMRIIGEMLTQEYWFWIKKLDRYYHRWKTFDEEHVEGPILDKEVWNREFDKCWEAMAQTDPKHTKRTMAFYIDKFNEQLAKGLYIDVDVNEIPYEQVEREPFTVEELNKRWFY